MTKVTNRMPCKVVSCVKSSRSSFQGFFAEKGRRYLVASRFYKAQLSYKHTERQRQLQRPMLVNGDAWKSVPDPFPNVTIDQYWPLTLAVVIPLEVYSLSVEFELGIQAICMSVVFYSVLILLEVSVVNLYASSFLLEMAETWDTSDKQIHCICNSNSTENLYF